MVINCWNNKFCFSLHQLIFKMKTFKSIWLWWGNTFLCWGEAILYFLKYAAGLPFTGKPFFFVSKKWIQSYKTIKQSMKYIKQNNSSWRWQDYFLQTWKDNLRVSLHRKKTAYRITVSRFFYELFKNKLYTYEKIQF